MARDNTHDLAYSGRRAGNIILRKVDNSYCQIVLIAFAIFRLGGIHGEYRIPKSPADCPRTNRMNHGGKVLKNDIPVRPIYLLEESHVP